MTGTPRITQNRTQQKKLDLAAFRLTYPIKRNANTNPPRGLIAVVFVPLLYGVDQRKLTGCQEGRVKGLAIHGQLLRLCGKGRW